MGIAQMCDEGVHDPVIPAQEGIQGVQHLLGPRLRGDDELLLPEQVMRGNGHDRHDRFY